MPSSEDFTWSKWWSVIQKLWELLWDSLESTQNHLVLAMSTWSETFSNTFYMDFSLVYLLGWQIPGRFSLIFFVSKLVMGQGQNFWPRLGRVTHLWFRFGLRKFPLKITNFQFFSFGSKNISPGGVKKYPGQRWVGLLFTAGQKYAWAGSGQGPFLFQMIDFEHIFQVPTSWIVIVIVVKMMKMRI